MIRFRERGSFGNFERWAKHVKDKDFRPILARYGQQGVDILASHTPKDTSNTANSWSYEVGVKSTGFTLQWMNSSENEGIPIVILLVYGHGTRGGTFVEGDNFINPVMQPLFQRLAQDLWEEVSKL